MKVKTSELTNAALDWAVYECEKRSGRTDVYMRFGSYGGKDIPWCNGPFKPSTDWSQGGPIIDCVDMQFWKWGGDHREEMQCAALPCKEEHGTRYTTYFGKSKLVAGLRAYVASKLGETVEIPKELL